MKQPKQNCKYCATINCKLPCHKENWDWEQRFEDKFKDMFNLIEAHTEMSERANLFIFISQEIKKAEKEAVDLCQRHYNDKLREAKKEVLKDLIKKLDEEMKYSYKEMERSKRKDLWNLASHFDSCLRTFQQIHQLIQKKLDE